MPPHLLDNLLKALSNLSPNIQNIGIRSPFGTDFFRLEVTLQPHLHTNKHKVEGRRKPKMAKSGIGENSNISTLISQCSYHISSQMRWHPLAPDKTYLS